MTAGLTRALSLTGALTRSSSRTLVFTRGHLRPDIDAIQQGNSHTIGKVSVDVAMEQEGPRVHNLVSQNHPRRACGSIGDKRVSHLRIFHLKKFGVLGISLFSAGPVEESGANTQDESFVRVFVHNVGSLDGWGIGHFTQLQQEVDPSTILGLDGNLLCQVIPGVQVVEDRVIPVGHHVIESIARSCPSVRGAPSAQCQVDQLVSVLRD